MILDLRPRKAVLLGHRRSDVDAYCSAYALKRMLEAEGCEAEFVSPEGIDRVAKAVQKRYWMDVKEGYEFGEEDLIVVLDTGRPELLGGLLEGLRESKATKVLIDHHPLSRGSEELFDRLLVDEKASSTCELVYGLMKEEGYEPDGELASVLLLGILTDTQNLANAGSETLLVVAELVKRGASVEELRKVIRLSKDRSEAIAKLKGAKRLKIYDVGGWLVCVTEVGSFHASVSKALLSLGCDLSVAIGRSDSGVRCSMRAAQEFVDETGIHLGHLASKLSGGRGGGHRMAAALNSDRGGEEFLKGLIEALEDEIGEEARAID